MRPTRWRPSAAIVPNVVAMIAFGIATMKLLLQRVWTTSSSSAAPYHLSEKPPQSVTTRSVPLKLNTTTTTIGRYRKM